MRRAVISRQVHFVFGVRDRPEPHFVCGNPCADIDTLFISPMRSSLIQPIAAGASNVTARCRPSPR